VENGNTKARGIMDLKILLNRMNIRGNLKFFLIIFIGFIIFTAAGAFLLMRIGYQGRERDLLQQLQQTASQKEALNLKISQVTRSMEPLEEQIRNLRRIVLIEKAMAEVNPNKNQITWPRSISSSKTNNSHNPDPQGVGITPLSEPRNANNRLPQAGQSLSRLKDYVKEMGQQNSMLKEKVNELSNLINVKAEEITKLNQENTALKGDLDKTKGDLDRAMKTQAELDNQAGNLKTQLAQKDSEILNLNTLKNSLDARVNELNSKILESIKVSAELERQIPQKEKDVSFLETELTRIKEELVKRTGDNAVLKEKVLGLTEALNKKEAERADIVKELEQLREAKKNLESELNDLRLAKTVNEGQVSQLNSRINELSSSSEGVKQNILQLVNLLNQKEVEIARLNQENTALKGDLDKTKGDLDELKSELDNQAGNLKTQLAQKESEILNLNRLKNSLEARVNELNNKILDSKKTSAELEKQIPQKEKYIFSMETEFNRIKEELSKETQNNKMLNKKLVELTDELDKKEKEKADIAKQLQQLGEAKKGLESEVSRAKVAKTADEGIGQNAAQLTALLNKKDLEIKTTQVEVSLLKKDLDRVYKEREGLLSAIKEKERSISWMQSELALTKELQKKNVEQLSQLKAINAALRERLADVSKELELLRLEDSPNPSKVKELLDSVNRELQQKRNDLENIDKGLSSYTD